MGHDSQKTETRIQPTTASVGHMELCALYPFVHRRGTSRRSVGRSGRLAATTHDDDDDDGGDGDDDDDDDDDGVERRTRAMREDEDATRKNAWDARGSMTSTTVARATDANDANEGEGEEEAFEAKLSALRGKRSKRAVKKETGEETVKAGTSDIGAAAAEAAKERARGVREFTVTDTVEEPQKDWGTETIVYEGPPARGEVVANVAMSWTLVWTPLAIQAAGRALWLSYKITDKRVSVLSISPLRKERTDIPMDQIEDVVCVGRGIGAWGDMVVTLRNGEKVELRSLPEYKKCEEVIREKMYKEKIIDF